MRDELRARGVHSLRGHDCSVGRQSAENDLRASVRSLKRPRGSRHLIFILRQRSAVKLAMKFREFPFAARTSEDRIRRIPSVHAIGKAFAFAQQRDPRSRNSTRIRNPSAGREEAICEEARFYISFDAPRFIFSHGLVNNRMASSSPRDRIVIAVATTSDIKICTNCRKKCDRKNIREIEALFYIEFTLTLID